jgi:hypothetical protein
MSKDVTTFNAYGGGAVPVNHLPQPASYTFEQLQRMAAAFAKSGLFGIKDQDSALSLMLIAQAENKHPALIMKDFDLIQGRLAKKAEAMLRDFQTSGGRIEWKELTDSRACAVFTHPLSPVPVTIDWDIERAKRAGLAGKEGGMYTKYTRAMLRSRCISEGVRSTAPQATSQFYTPEEIRAIEQEVAEPVSVTAAVAQAAEEVKKELPQDQFEELLASMDVKTRAELVTAFNAGWKIIKERGNETQQRAYRAAKEEMLSVVESGEIT